MIDAPSGHGSVGWVIIGQVSASVKSLDCVWKRVHYSSPAFRHPGLTQTYFAEIGTAPF
ncbi:hypothetical protein [Streptomyces sp. RKAG293]|uniref:hypothetical protein n=1 Tax=Streptomyces sp. RKAG293 TaxID=2893403 RepID=UPI0020348E82|nr:hypothetical protein [Streptomyces sp. RKAG293]MCM2416522.1 hypothetical protein [Streptomyces sp. RKAG293]